MNVSIGAKSDPGRRPNNEDQLLVVDTEYHGLSVDHVMVVADGMGGRNFGEEASTTAVETIEATVKELLRGPRDQINIREVLAASLRKANARIYELSQTDRRCQGMGTTCVIAVVSGTRLFIAHAGDSRAYCLRYGALEQLTDDHSYVAEQVRTGVITEEEARASRFRNVITRAVGIDPIIEPDVNEYTLQGVDALLLCTDGLTNMVDDATIEQALRSDATAQQTVDFLVEVANRNGGKDNITVVLARLEDEDAARLRREIGGGASPLPLSELKPKKSLLDPERSTFFSPWTLITGLIFVVIVLIAGLVNLKTNLGLSASNLPDTQKTSKVPIPTVDLSAVSYKAPVTFFYQPVQDEPMAHDPIDGSLTVVTDTGQIVHLSASAQPVFKFQLQSESSKTNSAAGSGANLHFADDVQGNLYVADAKARMLTKYKPNGELIGAIAKGALTKPESLAVGSDGTVYIIDAGRLKIIRAVSAPKT